MPLEYISCYLAAYDKCGETCLQTARGLQQSRGDSFNKSREGNQYSANYNFTVRSSTISPGWSDDTLTGCIQFVPAAPLNLIKRLIEAQWVAAISELLMNMLLESHEIDWRVQSSLWFSSTERHTLPIDRFHISWGKTHFSPPNSIKLVNFNSLLKWQAIGSKYHLAKRL